MFIMWIALAICVACHMRKDFIPDYQYFVGLDVEGQMSFTIIMFNCRKKLLTIKGGSNSKEERVKL